MTDARLLRPRKFAPHHVWAISHYVERPDRLADLSGIWHVDVDCPAIRDTSDADFTWNDVAEIDPLTGAFWNWSQWSDGWDYAGISPDSGEHQWFDLGEWRSCLRCGSVPHQPVSVCPRCYLTPCDCD